MTLLTPHEYAFNIAMLRDPQVETHQLKFDLVLWLTIKVNLFLGNQ